VLFTLAITAILAFGFGVGEILSRLLIGLSFLGLLLLGSPARHLVKWRMEKLGLWGRPTVIIGAGKTSARLIRTFQREWSLGYKPVAVFDFRLAPRGRVLEGVPYGGTVIDAIELAREQRIDSIIFAMPQVRRKYLAEFVDRAGLYFRHVSVTPNMDGIVTSAVVAKDFSGICGLEIRQTLLEPWPRRTKRALDLVGVLVGGLLIGPLLLAIATLIKLDSPGPVFFKQLRPGAQGQYFSFWKFRTMYPDAEQRLTDLLRASPDLRTEWEDGYKLRVDPRITRIGRFLRKTSLDELPQLWNILRGEMSLVGPRPILREEVPKYGKVYGLYQRVRPGITGLWQVSGRSDTSYTERVDMAALYVRNWSVWLDLIILARTVKSVVLRQGAI
jgi:Undecaprenyl-phosphate galactose phosphotransferase WbaP